MPDSQFNTQPPRLLPSAELPPYSYVSGHFPHPVRDRDGHMAGHVAKLPNPPDPAHWRECPEYQRALDLFNHGYYWEAHEEWESLWHAVERRGLLADFFKGLIKLAAAGVKIREGRPAGAARHARRAKELFDATAGRLSAGGITVPRANARLMGLSLDELQSIATRLTHEPPQLYARDPMPPVEIVFDFRLVPSD